MCLCVCADVCNVIYVNKQTDNNRMFGCRQQFSLPENAGGVRDLPVPDFDDQDLSSFEMVPDFWLQEQSSDEEPEIGDVKTPF